MAFINCKFKSAALGKATEMNVIVPDKSQNRQPPYPVVYLLHGLSDDFSIWMRRTSIERYAENFNAVIVMPDGGRGFYTDMKHGANYWTAIASELPEVVASIFPVSTRREDTFAAGLSMGGYGALKLALRQPDKFAAAAALSSVADIALWFAIHENTGETADIFGTPDDLARDRNDLFPLATECASCPTPPRLLSICGTEDPLRHSNLKFREHLQNIKYPDFQYIEGPGSHNWDFWDKWIQKALQFLLLPT